MEYSECERNLSVLSQTAAAAAASLLRSFVCVFVCLFAAFSLDAEQPDYDLDSDDDSFVNKLKKKMEISFLQFEEMIDRLEKGSGQQVSSY